MTSTQFKVLLVVAGSLAVAGLAAWGILSKPAPSSLDLNKSQADAKPSVDFQLSSDSSKKTGTAAQGAAKNTPATPPPRPAAASPSPDLAAKPDSSKIDASPPARRGTFESPPSVATPPATPPRGSDSGLLMPERGGGDTAAPRPAGDTAAPATDVKLPPIASPGPADGGAKPLDGKTGEPTRLTPERTPIPEATRAPGDPSKSTPGGDTPRVTPPRNDEPLRPTREAGAAAPKTDAAGRSSSGRVLRDSELERPGGSAPPPRNSGSGTPSRDNVKASTASYTIEQGDTLSRIAAKQYGDENLWTEIQKANPGLDEKKLIVGKTIALPEVAPKSAAVEPPKPPANSPDASPAGTRAKPEKSEPSAASAGTHTVASGESLVKIARNVLKDESRWQEIYDLNRDKLKSANAIVEGMVLKMPPARKDDAAAKKPDAAKKPENPRKR